MRNAFQGALRASMMGVSFVSGTGHTPTPLAFVSSSFPLSVLPDIRLRRTHRRAEHSPGGRDCLSFSAFSWSYRTKVYKKDEHRILNLVAVGCLADLDLVEAVVEWCLMAVFLILATVGRKGK